VEVKINLHLYAGWNWTAIHFGRRKLPPPDSFYSFLIQTEPERPQNLNVANAPIRTQSKI